MFGLVFSILLGVHLCYSQSTQPNILFLLVDDLGIWYKTTVVKLCFKEISVDLCECTAIQKYNLKLCTVN